MSDSGKKEEGESGEKDDANPNSQPTPAPNQDLTDMAVKFLSNPRVMSHPLEAKKAFLRKKGLTEAEISSAIKMAASVQPTQSAAAVVPFGSPSAPPLPPRPLTPLQPVQQRRKWSEYALIAAAVGGVGYALFHFVRNYVIPWLSAPRQQVERLEAVQSSVNQLNISMTETVTTLKESNRAIQALLSEQQQHMQLLTAQVTGLQTSLAQHTNGQPLRQLKDELSTLKGLLLNRHQFPPSPTPMGVAGRGGASIPEWQKNSNSPNPKSSTPSRGLLMTQHEEDASPSETEASEGLRRTKEEGAVAGQNGGTTAGDKSVLENEEESQTQQSSDQTT